MDVVKDILSFFSFFFSLGRKKANEASTYVSTMIEKKRIRKCVCEKKEEIGSVCVRERERESKSKSGRIYISGKNDFYTLARESFLEIRLKIDVLTLYIRTFLNSRRVTRIND